MPIPVFLLVLYTDSLYVKDKNVDDVLHQIISKIFQVNF